MNWSASNLPSGVSIGDKTGKLKVDANTEPGTYTVKVKATVSGYSLSAETERDVELEVFHTEGNTSSENYEEEKSGVGLMPSDEIKEIMFSSELPADGFYKVF